VVLKTRVPQRSHAVITLGALGFGELLGGTV